MRIRNLPLAWWEQDAILAMDFVRCQAADKGEGDEQPAVSTRKLTPALFDALF